ncbi:MAG: T9SS type A sorting domain-containing protein [Ignavibacteriae bacterium]|nr:T9SS C-terminal target domain-containing protein [Ignavibacteriota bacterium]NOG97092.1 T9SS type A sorting domain-containing protein [Ignavibacteriota bacterium]
MPFTSNPIQTFIYSRPDEFSDYELTDSSLFSMSIESSAWDPVSGNLWVSNDSRGVDTNGVAIYTHLTWYEYDVATKALVDSFTLPSPDPEPSDEYPRGLDFSPDGQFAYVGLFGTGYDRIYKFDRLTGVAQELGFVADNYELSQNYPNPFNPTTTISFTIPEASDVTLKVYDMIGQEVATLVNSEMSAGKFNVSFDASNLASGTYVYELRAGKTVITNKMMLLK